MKTIKITLLAALLMTFLVSCEGGKFCMKPTGSEVTQTISLDAFDGIELEISGNVTIHRDSVQQVKITGHQNIIDNIEHHVVNGVWHIEFDQCVYKTGKLEIEIWLPTLKTVKLAGSGNITAVDSFGGVNTFTAELAGSGDIDVDVSASVVKAELAGSGNMQMGIDADQLEATIAGSGDMDLRGRARNEELTIAGSGSIHAYDVLAETAKVEISGSGNMEVQVSTHLDIKISGSGTVYYKGQPTINSQVTGSGEVKHVN